MSNGNSQPQQRAIRLIFEYEGERVRLIVQQPVDLAGVDTSPPGTDSPGYNCKMQMLASRSAGFVRT